MIFRAVCRAVLVALAAALCLPLAWAADLDGPLTLVVGFPAGGSLDRVANVLAGPLSKELGVAVKVENRPGDGGRVAAQGLRKRLASDNEVMLANPAAMAVAPMVFKDVGYDPEKDFAPIAQVCEYDFAIAVSPTSPSDRLMFLVTWLWANPQQSRFGIPATGSLPHFFSLMLGDALAIKPQVVGYKGSAALVDDLLKGQIPIAIDGLDTLYPQHKAGKVRVLAASSSKRAPFAPEIPTFRESGLKMDASGWQVIFAPASMPQPKVQAISRAVQRVLARPEVRAAMEKIYVTPVYNGPAESRIMVRAFRERWEPVVRRSGFAP